jgi:ribosome assembly protein RRB1
MGAPRTQFPHTLYMAAGTQASQPRQNYIAIMKLAGMGQAGHGKKVRYFGRHFGVSSAPCFRRGAAPHPPILFSNIIYLLYICLHVYQTIQAKAEDSDGDDDLMSDEEDDDYAGEAPPRLHVRQVQHQGGVNRIRTLPQQPGVVATWADTGHVHVWDLTQHLAVR